MTEDRKPVERPKPARIENHAQGFDIAGTEVVDALSQAGQKYFLAVAALNEAVMQVANDHMAASTEAAQALGKCHSLPEAMRVHSDLAKSNGEAFVRGWSRWLDTSNRLMSESLGQYRKA